MEIDKSIETLSKKQIKLINSLKIKKYRFKNQLFLIEGEKNCLELIDTRKDIIKYFIIPENISNKTIKLVENIINLGFKVFRIDKITYQKISDTETPQEILAIANLIPQQFQLTSPIVILDKITDPGNLGTIIRSMDWFGIKQLILSKNCVDIFNPKVIRSTMGSILRIKYYIPDDLLEFIKFNLKNFKIIGTFPDAPITLENYKFPKKFAIVIGNEAKGISRHIELYIDDKIKIKGYGKAESLNVSVATSIILYEISKYFHN